MQVLEAVLEHDDVAALGGVEDVHDAVEELPTPGPTEQGQARAFRDLPVLGWHAEPHEGGHLCGHAVYDHAERAALPEERDAEAPDAAQAKGELVLLTPDERKLDASERHERLDGGLGVAGRELLPSHRHQLALDAHARSSWHLEVDIRGITVARLLEQAKHGVSVVPHESLLRCSSDQRSVRLAQRDQAASVDGALQ